MAENQPPPSTNEHLPPQQNLLSELAVEVQAEIYSYLNYSDLCSLRATCRSLHNPFTDPQVPLKKELSWAWTRTGQCYKQIYQLPRQNGPARLFGTARREAAFYALAAGVTPLIVNWLLNPDEYHFPCTKCCRMTELKRFPYFLWEQSFLVMFPDDSHVNQSHQEFFDSLVCGECFTTRYPGHFTLLGTSNHDEYMIKCLECDLTKVIPAEQLSMQMIISAFCDVCFKKVNHQWFDYKKFLQDSLSKMEEFERTAFFGPKWEDLPACPVPRAVVRTLSSRKHGLRHFPSHLHHPKQASQWTGFIKTEFANFRLLITTKERKDEEHGEMESKPQLPQNNGLRRSTLEEGYLVFLAIFFTLSAVYMLTLLWEMLAE